MVTPIIMNSTAKITINPTFFFNLSHLSKLASTNFSQKTLTIQWDQLRGMILGHTLAASSPDFRVVEYILSILELPETG